MRSYVLWPSLCVVAALAMASRTASAHGMRTAYLELEAGEVQTAVRLRAPVGAKVEAVLEGCALSPRGGHLDADGAELRFFLADCATLVGARVGVSGLGGELDEAVISVRDELGRAHTALLSAREATFVVPPRSTGWAVATSYVAHGVRHIATGYDHLLLLLLLVLQLVRLRPILLVESAFSLSHGLAFAATALGWVQIAPAPVEACIALSLVLVALEIGRVTPSPRSLAALALAFGAVHGLGFAGGLRELGVPEDHAASALLGFGLGVELGQVVVVLTAWAALRGLRRFAVDGRVANVTAIVGGGLAAYWLFDRTHALLVGL